MSMTTLTFVGNLTGDPQTRSTGEGVHVTAMRVAVNRRHQNADGSWANATPTFHAVEAWGSLAVNAAASLRRGDRVVVVGRMTSHTYVKDGATRTVVKVRADAIGVDLSFTRTQLRRAS
jgi:single-strand DNA-binding protein